MTRVCMVAFTSYPADVRVRRQAEALVEAGISVDVICLRNQNQPYRDVVEGVYVFRLPLRRQQWLEKYHYLAHYPLFMVLAFIKLSTLHFRKRYSIIHVHNMPDILILSALIPALTGAKLILDIHDPMPEVYMAKYSKTESHPAIRLLRFMEKCSIKIASLVITVNSSCRDLLVSRSCPETKVHVILNSPQEKVFSRGPSRKREDEAWTHNGNFIVMYHGNLTRRNGIEVALRAFALIREKVPNLTFHVYGRGEFLDNFLDLVRKLNLGDIVKYYGLVPHETIAAAIQSIDVGLVPNERSKHWDLAMPTRIWEYLCAGKPVIAPRTPGILTYFDEDSLYFFRSGDTWDLARAILHVYKRPTRRRIVLERGIAVYKAHRWEVQKEHFLELVEKLLNQSGPQFSRKQDGEHIEMWRR